MTGKMNRRRFLKQAAGAAIGGVVFPYIIPAGAVGAEGVAPSERIVMGCIGVGSQGTGNMSAFMRIADVQVVAVCDVDKEYPASTTGGRTFGREPARKLVERNYGEQSPGGTYKGCAVYNDFREVLARGDIDAVTVCTPDHWHGLISAEAARAGKDIYCEKPLVNTISEGRAVCNAVKEFGRVLQTGSHERSNNTVRYACELIRNGRIGKLHTITVNMPNNDPHHMQIIKTNQPQPVMPVPAGLDYDMWLGPTPKADYTQKRSHFWWRFILEYGGGEMTDRGAHIIDLGQFANATDDTGPVEIWGTGKRAPGGGLFDAFMEYDFGCRYANGVRLVGVSKGPRGLKLEGSEGWIFINIHGGRLEARPESLLREEIGPGEIHLGRSVSHHQNFIDAVKARRQPFASAEVGHRTATICHLVNIAMMTGKRIIWDPVAERITNDAEANRLVEKPMRSPWRV